MHFRSASILQLNFLVFIIVSVFSSSVGAQQVIEQSDDVTISDDFSFDDAIFDADFLGEDLFAETEDSDSWLDDFTFKISQQFFGQTNRHGIDLPSGATALETPVVENNRMSMLIKYQNPFAPGWLLQASAQAKVYWSTDYEAEAKGESFDTEYQLNELFVQRSFDSHSVKVGRQTVVWGEAIGNSVLDVINIFEFKDLSFINIEDARLNQWMAVWDYYGDNTQVSTFLNLYPEFNPPPVRGSPLFFEPLYNLTKYKRNKPLFEIGTRWQRSNSSGDLAFMAAYLYENELRYESPSNGIGDAVPVKNDFALVGMSANRAIGKLLLLVDIAYSHGITVDSFIAPTTTSPLPVVSRRKKNQIGTSFGFEYQIDNYQNISVSFRAQTVLEAEDDLIADEELVNDGVFGSVQIRYGRTLLHDDLSLSADVQAGLDGDLLLVNVGLSYMVNDFWSISSQITASDTSSSSPAAFLDEDVRIGATISYSF